MMRTQNKNVVNMLLNFISKSKKIDEKEKVVLLVNTFFSKGDTKDIPSLEKLNISSISIVESDEEKIGIKIELVEAGLLVGKEGRTIKQLGGFISKKLDKKARIYVIDITEDEDDNQEIDNQLLRENEHMQ